MIDLRLVVGGVLVLSGLAAPLLFEMDRPAALARTDGVDSHAAPAAEGHGEPAHGEPHEEAQEITPRPSREFDDVSTPLRVERRVDDDGVEYVTLVGANVSLHTVARRVAELSNRLLFGFEERSLAAPLVTVDLRDRPIEEALEYVLGSAGLTAEISPTVLDIRTLELSGNADALRQRALAGYTRSTQRLADGVLAPRSRLAQGELEEERGNHAAAIGHYQLLVDSYPASPLVIEATLRIAESLARQGEWNLALGQFTRVTEISPESLSAEGDLPRPIADYRSLATLQIARCNIELGRAEFAVLILRVHEREYPSIDNDQLVQRMLLSARARHATGAHILALTELEELERGPISIDVAIAALELRAQCFEGLDLLKDAARAWLFHARQVRDPARAHSFERAAELFLALGEPLAVLFVAKEAQSVGTEADLGTQIRRARAALGMPVELDANNSTPQERFEAAERAAARSDWEGVAELIEPLYRDLESAPIDLRDDIVLARASHAFATVGLEGALDVLREARAVVERVAPNGLARLDGYAGQLLEQSRQFERALEAYEGRY